MNFAPIFIYVLSYSKIWFRLIKMIRAIFRCNGTYKQIHNNSRNMGLIAGLSKGMEEFSYASAYYLRGFHLDPLQLAFAGILASTIYSFQKFEWLYYIYVIRTIEYDLLKFRTKHFNTTLHINDFKVDSLNRAYCYISWGEGEKLVLWLNPAEENTPLMNALVYSKLTKK